MPNWISTAYAAVFGKKSRGKKNGEAPADDEDETKPDAESEDDDENRASPPWDEDDGEADEDEENAPDPDDEDDDTEANDETEDESEPTVDPDDEEEDVPPAARKPKGKRKSAARPSGHAGRRTGGRQDFAWMVKRFGHDFAARAYADGLGRFTALDRHDRLMAGRVHTLEKRLASLGKLGEGNPPSASPRGKSPGPPVASLNPGIDQYADFLKGHGTDR